MADSLTLPGDLKTKVLSFPEYRMGAHRVALVVRGGEIIEDVIIAWGDEVVSVGHEDGGAELISDDIIDVIDRSPQAG